MPTIFGLINRHNEPIAKNLEDCVTDSLKNMNHRVEKHTLDHCFLGTSELNFLPKMNRIIWDEEKSILGASIGRIYDKERFSCENVSKSSYLNDTKFIIDLYHKKDLDFVKYLNGLFNIIIFDEQKKRIIIANDRYGFYPLSHYIDKQKIVFASKAKQILDTANLSPTLDKVAVAEFFIFTYPLKTRTFFKQVKLVKPATELVYDIVENQVKSVQYWDFTVPKDRNYSMSALLQIFKKLMQKSIEKRVQDKEDIGVMLSGGLDSRLISAFAAQTKKNVITFTFGFKNCWQRIIAKKVSERLGIENYFYEIPSTFLAEYAENVVYNGDGLIRIRDCHYVSMLEKIRKKVDTVLLGTFEAHFRSEAWVENIRSKREMMSYLFQKGRRLKEYSNIFTDNFIKKTKSNVITDFREIFDERKFSSIPDIAKYWSYTQTHRRIIFHAFQVYNWYLETRHPYLDKDLTDFFTFRLPYKLLKHARFQKKALDYCFPFLSDIPYERTLVPPTSHHTMELLGAMVLWANHRLKLFIDRLTKDRIALTPSDFRRYDRWLRTGSKTFTKNLLLDQRTLRRGFFKPNAIQKILDEHMNYKKNHEELICDLINFELFNRIFVDKNIV